MGAQTIGCSIRKNSVSRVFMRVLRRAAWLLLGNAAVLVVTLAGSRRAGRECFRTGLRDRSRLPEDSLEAHRVDGSLSI